MEEVLSLSIEPIGLKTGEEIGKFFNQYYSIPESVKERIEIVFMKEEEFPKNVLQRLFKPDSEIVFSTMNGVLFSEFVKQTLSDPDPQRIHYFKFVTVRHLN